MPDQSSASSEHALIQEITAPLATLPDDPVPTVADVEFPLVLRGYDRLAVDAYVRKTSQLVAELQATRSPEAAVRRALERVGDEVSGILQRAHDTAEQITAQSRREAEDRLEQAREEARRIAASGEQRIKDLDSDADRIWAERLRIIDDARELAGQLIALADAAAERFPPAEDTGSIPPADPDPEPDPGQPEAAEEPGEPAETAVFDAEAEGQGDQPAAAAAEPDVEETAVLPRLEPEGDGPGAGG
jgi:ElaB/YqjD/DUF883 family membrane-anchored ribosome-binding protein